MKKRVIGLLMAFVLANSTILAGCGASSSDDLLSEIQAKGKIVIAMEGQWSPWTYHDETGELVGFDTEVGKAIASRLGVEAEFVEGEWDGLFTGLETGRYDVIINGVEITEERTNKYNFTTPYAYMHTALVVLDTNTDINSFEDLAGKKTANSLGSTYADTAAAYGATVENVDTLSETIDMLTSGRSDATLNSVDSIADYLSVHPDAPIKIVATSEDASSVSIPIRKTDATKTFEEALNKAIADMQADGTLTALSNKYFGMDITKAE